MCLGLEGTASTKRLAVRNGVVWGLRYAGQASSNVWPVETSDSDVSLLQVADLIKADRLHRLNRVVMEVATERSQRFSGRTLEVRM